MARIKAATPEEIERIKDHFEKQGYGRIDDHTASYQREILIKIREGTLGDTKTN